MGKKRKRRVLGPPTQEMIAAFKEGKTIIASRPDAIARLIDTAIWLWALEKDPLAIHLSVMAPYHCLEDMGKKTGKGPKLKNTIGAEVFTQAYDFLRHASNNPTAHISLPPSANSFILFDAITSFERIFGKLTVYMRAFRAYFLIFGTPGYKPREDLRSRAADFLPEGVTLDEVERLMSRLDFFAKLAEMFAIQYGATPHIKSP